MSDKQELLEIMLKDMLASVEHFYGPSGLGKVVTQMKRINKCRDDQKEIDALEKMLTEIRL